MTSPPLTPAGRHYLETLLYGPEERPSEPLTPCYRKLRDAGLVTWTGVAVEPTKAGYEALGLVAPRPPAAGRPSSTPRLLELEPLQVADQLDLRIRRHLDQLVALGACGQAHREGRSELALAFANFCRSVQRGEPNKLGSTHLAYLLVALAPYVRLTPERNLDTSDPVALVLLAALARDRLQTGEPLDVGHLAALSGLHPKAIRLLARQGKLQLDRGEEGLEAPAVEARRWLRSRDVLGV